MLQFMTGSSQRTFRFVAIIFVLVLGVATFGTYLAIESAHRAFLLNLEQRVDGRLNDSMSALVLWYQRLLDQTERVARSDMFRLFATETGKNDNSDPSGDVNDAVPIIRKELQNLSDYTAIIGFQLVNPRMESLVGYDEAETELSPQQQALVKTVFETGKPVADNAYIRDGILVANIAYPVHAPEYVDAAADTPVAVLLMICDLSTCLHNLRQNSDAMVAGEQLFLLQSGKAGLEELRSDGEIRHPGDWSLQNGRLSLKVRKLADGTRAYTKALPAPGLPCLVGYAVAYDSAQEEYLRHRNYILLMSVQGTIIVLLLVGGFWWQLVWRRERLVSTELNQLNDTVNRQNQLLESIDNTMPGGVMLSDARHILLHVNRSCARMLEHSPQSLVGISLPSLFLSPTNETVRDLLDSVARTEQEQTITTNLNQNGRTLHWRMTGTPFRNAEEQTVGVVTVFQDVTDEVEKNRRHQQHMDKIISVLVRAIEAVDPYLCGQFTVTHALAGKLVQRLHFSEEDAAIVHTAAQLYQIGLLQVPRELLNKEDKLSPEERAVLERHVSHAREALAAMEFDEAVVKAVGQMYERLDGSGYPEKLHGDQIGQPARLLAVANTFCAVVRPRAYRDAKSPEMALDILSVTPTAYDPAMVDALREFLKTQEGVAFLKQLKTAK